MRKALSILEKGLLTLATIALLLMMASITVDALGRHLFNRPFQGNFEITSLYFMVILVFATLSANYANDSHVRLDVLSGPLRDRMGRNYARLIGLICLPVFAYFAWHSSAEAISKFQHLERKMGAIPYPIYLSYVWVALGAVTLTVRFVLDIIAPLDPSQEDVSEAPNT
jgi:TRAP-type C4-dicarboxylate transport system permease small subunit